MFKSSKPKVSSETQGNITVTHYKIKVKKKKPDPMFPTYNDAECLWPSQTRGKTAYWGSPEPKQVRNPGGQTPNSASPHLISTSSSDIQFLSSLWIAIHFFLLVWFHTLSPALLARYPKALASPSWDLQGNSDFTFTTSHNSVSRPPWWNCHAKCLTSAVFLNLRGWFYNLFPMVLDS